MTRDFSELPESRPAKPNMLRLVSLGELGEVGRNMVILETEGRILTIDCGVLLPEEAQPGVDLILPDFSYIKGRINQVVGIVSAHGHEDHIGVTSYLLKHRDDIPVYGLGLTLALAELKL